MPAPSLLAALLLLPLFAAPRAPTDPTFTIQLPPAQVQFEIAGLENPFLGVVLVSLSPDLAHYFVGLPPLLSDAVVVAYGVGDANGYQVAVPDAWFPTGMVLHAQGVTIDGVGIHSTNTVGFVLGPTVVDY